MIRLNDLIDLIDQTDCYQQAYLDPTTNETCIVHELIWAGRYETVFEQLIEGNWIGCPNDQVIQSEKMKPAFAHLVATKDQHEALMAALENSSSVYFFQTIEDLGLKGSWLDFRRRILRNIAIAWCDDHHLPY